MSIFAETGQIDLTKDYFPELVGEGKRYQTNSDIGRAVVEKDLHIAQLEAEKRKVLEDLHARVKEGELYDKLKQLYEKSPSTGPDTNTGGNGTNINGLTPEQATELFNKQLQQYESSKRAQENENAVKAKLVEKFGTNFAPKLNETATKLNVSREYLEGLALSNPDVFYRVIGIDEKPATQPFSNYNPPRPSVESQGFKMNINQERTQSYYDDLRRTKPAEYHSKEVQAQEYKDALRLGEAFFDK